MKTLKLILFGTMLLLANMARAQVTVNVNVGSPPLWGPVGYAEERYYYLPDVEAYYDVQNSMFIYYGGGVWLHRTYLPAMYNNYDLYGGYKVVLTGFHGNNPYVYFNKHKMKYAKGYHGKPQKTIGMNPGKGGNGNGHSNYNGGGNGKNNNQSQGGKQGGNYGGSQSGKQGGGHGGNQGGSQGGNQGGSSGGKQGGSHGGNQGGSPGGKQGGGNGGNHGGGGHGGGKK